MEEKLNNLKDHVVILIGDHGARVAKLNKIDSGWSVFDIQFTTSQVMDIVGKDIILW